MLCGAEYSTYSWEEKRKNQDLDFKGHSMKEYRLMQPLRKMETHHALTQKGDGPYELYETYWVRRHLFHILLFLCWRTPPKWTFHYFLLFTQGKRNKIFEWGISKIYYISHHVPWDPFLLRSARQLRECFVCCSICALGSLLQRGKPRNG